MIARQSVGRSVNTREFLRSCLSHLPVISSCRSSVIPCLQLRRITVEAFLC